MILKNPLFNYTIDGYLRYEFNVGIAYENNPTKAIKIINERVKYPIKDFFHARKVVTEDPYLFDADDVIGHLLGFPGRHRQRPHRRVCRLPHQVVEGGTF